MREISMEEWNATPVDYLRHPDLHPKLWGRAPGDAAYENEREQAFKKYGYKEHDPSTPAGNPGYYGVAQGVKAQGRHGSWAMWRSIWGCSR